MNTRHLIRTSTYEEIIARNKSKPENIIRIKCNVLEILSILCNGFGITQITNYCRISKKKQFQIVFIMIIFILLNPY